MNEGSGIAEKAHLTGVPASHPVLAVQLMLERKGIPYVRRDLPNGLQRLLPVLGYKQGTVPVLRIDGTRVQGSTQIARVLEGLAPEPPLFPAEPEKRRRVEELEAWADADLQETVRKLGQWAAKQDPSALGPIAAASDVPLPPGAVRATMPVLGPVVLATLNVSRDRAKRALDELPTELDRADAAIADGIIGGEEPNAADFQVATSVRLATLIDELQPLLAERPSTALAYRLAPNYPGRFTAPLGLG